MRRALVPSGAFSLATPGSIAELLGYRLHTIVAKIGSAVIRVCEGRYGISRREWHILGLLDTLGAQAPSQLAENCHLDRPRISRAISALAARGLIARSRVANNHKRVILELTPSGRDLQRRVFEDVASINAKVLDGLDPAQLAELHRLLTLLKAKADAVAREAARELHADRWRGRSARATKIVSNNSPL